MGPSYSDRQISSFPGVLKRFGGNPQKSFVCCFGVADGAPGLRKLGKGSPIELQPRLLSPPLKDVDKIPRRKKNNQKSKNSTHKHFCIGLKETSPQLRTTFPGVFPTSHERHKPVLRHDAGHTETGY